MNAVLWLVSAFAVAVPEQPEVGFAQMAPVQRGAAAVERTPNRTRAVVLISGLRLHPFSSRGVTRAEWHSWQQPGCPLVKALAQEADVFALTYSQEVPVERVAETPVLRNAVRTLKALGYREVVLIGHSAGGLVARQFVEDHPDAGVTRVIQVSSPNGGSNWAKARVAVRRNQETFLASLTKHDRQHLIVERSAKRIPASVEFVCVVCRLNIPVISPIKEKNGKPARALLPPGDGLVSTVCQWTPDLQEQGVPAVLLPLGHSTVMHNPAGIAALTRLVRERVGRWDAATVNAARPHILGTDRKPR